MCYLNKNCKSRNAFSFQSRKPYSIRDCIYMQIYRISTLVFGAVIKLLAYT